VVRRSTPLLSFMSSDALTDRKSTSGACESAHALSLNIRIARNLSWGNSETSFYSSRFFFLFIFLLFYFFFISNLLYFLTFPRRKRIHLVSLWQRSKLSQRGILRKISRCQKGIYWQLFSRIYAMQISAKCVSEVGKILLL